LVQAENWTDALRASHAWLEDEPFSARPAMLGSAIAASAIENFDEAAEIARRGLVSNPDDPGLANNLAFALASGGKVEEAARILASIGTEPVPSQLVALTATSGLIAFRSGDRATGRSKYLKAIKLAKENQLSLHEALASIYLARETARSGADDVEEMLKHVKESLPKISVPSINVALRKLNQELQKKDHPPVTSKDDKKVQNETQVIQLPKTDTPWAKG
jgi:Tfp pilus assembly protein PilF